VSGCWRMSKAAGLLMLAPHCRGSSPLIYAAAASGGQTQILILRLL